MSTVLFTAVVENGQVKLKFPDDPNVGEGPTNFTEALTVSQFRELGDSLPTVRSCDRLKVLLSKAERELSLQHGQAQIAAGNELDRLKDCQRFLGVIS